MKTFHHRAHHQPQSCKTWNCWYLFHHSAASRNWQPSVWASCCFLERLSRVCLRFRRPSLLAIWWDCLGLGVHSCPWTVCSSQCFWDWISPGLVPGRCRALCCIAMSWNIIDITKGHFRQRQAIWGPMHETWKKAFFRLSLKGYQQK